MKRPSSLTTGFAGLEARIVGEARQPLGCARAVQREFVDVDFLDAFGPGHVAITLDERMSAVGEDAFGFVVLVGRLRIVGHAARLQIKAADLCALIAVRREDQLVFVRWAEVLRLQATLEGQVPPIENLLLVGDFRCAFGIDDIG